MEEYSAIKFGFCILLLCASVFCILYVLITEGRRISKEEDEHDLFM